MATKKFTIKKATKKDLLPLIFKYRPDYVTDESIEKIIKLLPFGCLSIVGQAFQMQYILLRLVNRYKIVRKLYEKLIWKEIYEQTQHK